ncbi:DNA methyltransferase [Archaeoglobus sp.]
MKAELIDNVQFIYELSLSMLELKSFGVKFKILNGLREFELLEVDDLDVLKKRLAYFKTIGGIQTDYSKIIGYNVTKSVNQYLTHWIYPYKGKFHPQMIRAILNIIRLKDGDTVLDPFIGSGTTALESQLLGIDCIGIDISPLCVLQSRVKVESIFVLDEIKRLRNDAVKAFSRFRVRDRESYESFLNSINDDRVKNFYEIAKHVSISDTVRRRRDVVDSFVKNLNLMIRSVEMHREVVDELKLKLGEVKIERGDARNLDLDDESVDGIVTSPPYSMKEMGYDVQKLRGLFIRVRGSGKERISIYNRDMMKAYREMFRVLKPNRYCVIVIGNATYQGKTIDNVKFTKEVCQKIGFKLVKTIDKIIYGLYNVIQNEKIMIFKKVI